MPAIVLAAVAVLVGAGILLKPVVHPAPRWRVVYTGATRQDGVATLPAEVREILENEVGLKHGTVTLTQVRPDGTSASSEPVDLTPRRSNGHIIKVRDDAVRVIDQKIADIVATVNANPAGEGKRALYAGLSKITFRDDEPVLVVGSGLDTESPDDFRALKWTVAPDQVIKAVVAAGQQPNLHHNPVLFVLTPVANGQPQLGQPELNYRRDFWMKALMSASASSVTFYETPASEESKGTVDAPVIPVSGPPSTPIPPQKKPKGKGKAEFTCQVGSAYFDDRSAALKDEGVTREALRPCVRKAIAAGATFHLDAWTSYDGRLTKDGKPAVDYPPNRDLSNRRNAAVVRLLISLGAERKHIAKPVGHGNVDQPYPKDPGSPRNRLVKITYTL